MDKDFLMLMDDLKIACDNYFKRAKDEDCDIDFTVNALKKKLDANKGNIIVEIAVSYVIRRLEGRKINEL